ncbi:hypothetical protein DdX_20456 [Ditylenchus destructor]|uniref:Uncharacterized protein n=1 Tax=Ditylenchus destructor TaxID=166010 RepID=A0AAD4MH57_9BILA|nr:hypothetical protein DdX_20456 [Ditylenchus destructor]
MALAAAIAEKDQQPERRPADEHHLGVVAEAVEQIGAAQDRDRRRDDDQRRGGRAFGGAGSVRRSTSTAIDTAAKANNVPELEMSASLPTGKKAAKAPRTRRSGW